MPVIGFLSAQSPETSADRLRGFREGLKYSGYIEGENVTIVYRWAEGQFDRVPALATELVRAGVAVIAALSNSVAVAVKATTTTIPIVFLATEDPVKLQSAARAMGLQIQVVNASTSHEINAAFATFVRERPDALLVGLDAFLNNRRAQLVNLASRYTLPAIFSNRDFAEIGGLMSYGSDIKDSYRQVGVYVGRILKGAKPADLPVVQASKFELVINAETARMLGLTVPDKLLAIADEVIE